MVENTNAVDVQVKRMYRYYNEEYIGKYFIEGENTSDYPCIDEDNYYYTDFSDYSVISPSEKPNRVIETKKIYTYKERKTVRYIKISDIVGSNGKVNFSEIVVRDKSGKRINYLYICIDCSEGFLTYIKNGIENENMSYIKNGGEILLDLMGYYRFDEFNLEISIYDDTNEEKSFDVAYYNEREGDIMMDMSFSDNYKCRDIYDVPTYIINYHNMTLYDIEWSSLKQTEGNISNSFTIEIIQEDTYYRFKDKYINYYYVAREYSDFQEGPTDLYPCESEEYIQMYRFRTRDVIQVDDYIEITEIDDSLSNHISSNVDYEIIGDFDLNHNGDYYLTLKTYFIQVNIMVTVSKEQNDLVEKYYKLLMDYNYLLDEYHVLENRILELQIQNDTLMDENIDLYMEYTDIYNTYLDIKKAYEELEIQLYDYEDNNNINDYNNLLIEYEALAESLSNMQNINKINKEEYNFLLSKYQTLEINYEQLSNINNQNINDYANLEERYDLLLKKYNELFENVESYSIVITDNELEYNNLFNLYNDLLDKYSDLEQILEGYKIEYQKIFELKNEYENLINSKNIEIEILQKERETLLLDYQQMTQKYEILEKDFNNINKDDIILYNEMIEEINNYKIKINELTYSLEKCERNIDLKEEEKNKITKEYENQLMNLRMNKKVQEESISEDIKVNSSYNNIIIIMIIISIIVLLLGFLIKIFYLNKNKN